MHAKNNDRHNNDHQDELGPDSAGQSGDLQGISDLADADSESVQELIEQGNAFEADAVDGVENAKDPDVSEVTTREVPEDDVPEEYRNAS
jgi:N utilization substance protein A